MNSAEAAVLAWFTDVEPPVGLGSLDAKSLASAIAVVWPEWMAKMHKATNALIDDYYRKIVDKEIGEIHMNRELMFESIAYKRSLARIREDLSVIYATNKSDLETKIKQTIKREKYYNKLRIEALVRRISMIVQHVNMRAADPRSDFDGGALWIMDMDKKTHTEDCLAMQGKVWSWSVLRFVNPANRHPGCGCHLEPNFEATPIITAPDEAPPGWDMGPVQAKPMTQVQFEKSTWNSLYRSQFS